MKKAYFRTLFIAGPLLFVAGVFFFINAGQDNNLTRTVALEEITVADQPGAASDLAVKSATPARTSTRRPQPVKGERLILIADFSYITSEYLKTHWEEELGCFGLEEDNEVLCDYPELSASTYEEAIWMIENGYPTASELRELSLLSDEQLKNLSRRNYWLPSLLLAQRYATIGNKKGALKYFLSNEARKLSPYGLQRWANSLTANPDPSQPGMSYVQAAINLKKAALLGDYTAAQALNGLYDSYWKGRPHISLVTNISDTAHWELSRRLGTPQDQWPTARPRGG